MSNRIALADATEAQMREFATNHLGLEVKPSDNASKLRVAIAKAWSEPTIIVSEAGAAQAQTEAVSAKPKAAAPVRSSGALVPKDSHKDPRVTLIVARQEGPGGDRPVEVAVNGTLILIPRGEPVTIAYRYYEALNNAVQTIYEQDRDGEVIGRDVHAYPFQVMAMPTPDEVSAWLASQSE